jgi:hypothetical protein
MVMRAFNCALFAAVSVLVASTAMAQTSATTVGSKVSRGGYTTGGTAGSAAVGGMSASTIGLGAASRTSSAIGGAGSAAAVNGRAISTTRIRENPQMLGAQSRARAWDGGTWSQSMTNTRVRQNGDVSSWTRSMAHEPGSKPAMSRTRVR